MKKKLEKIYEFIEKYHIFFLIEFFVAFGMVIVNIVDAATENLYFLFPALYFFCFGSFLTVLEIAKRKKNREIRIQLLSLIATSTTLIVVAQAFFVKLYRVEANKELFIPFIIIYGSYAVIKFIIVISEIVAAIVKRNRTIFCTLIFSLLGAFYTAFMFTLFMFEYSGVRVSSEYAELFLLILSITIFALNLLGATTNLVLLLKTYSEYQIQEK